MAATAFGKRRANPEATSTNNLKLAACGTPAAVCMQAYDKTIATSGTLVSLVFDGVTYTMPTPLPLTDLTAVRDAIVAILSTVEVDVFLTVKHDGTKLYIKHIGKTAELGAITLSGGAMTRVEACTVLTHCKYQFNVIGAQDVAYDGGVADQLATVPVAYAGVASTDAATAATIAGEMVTLLAAVGGTVANVDVSVDNENEVFVCSFYAASSDNGLFTVDGVEVNSNLCWQTFDALGATGYSFGE